MSQEGEFDRIVEATIAAFHEKVIDRDKEYPMELAKALGVGLDFRVCSWIHNFI